MAITQEQQKQHAWWVQFVPEINPSVWLCINVVCAVASLVALAGLVVLLVTKDDLSNWPTASAFYLAWDFGTTLVWCAEVGLTVAYALLLEEGDGDKADEEEQGSTEQASTESAENGLSTENWVELVIAVIMLADSAETIYGGTTPTGNLGLKVAAALLNLLVFGYASLQSWQSLKATDGGL